VDEEKGAYPFLLAKQNPLGSGKGGYDRLRGCGVRVQGIDGDRAVFPLPEAEPVEDESDVSLGSPADRGAYPHMCVGVVDPAGDGDWRRQILASDPEGIAGPLGQ